MFGNVTLKQLRTMLATIAILSVTACGSSGSPTATSARTAAPEWLPSETISRSEAIDHALTLATRSMLGVTPVEDARNPVAKLMLYNESSGLRDATANLATNEQYVWVVQIEGQSHSAGISDGVDDLYDYAVFVFNAADKQFLMGLRRYEPFFQSDSLEIPTPLPPTLTPTPVTG